MKKTFLKNCMLVGLVMILIGIPSINAEEPKNYDAFVSFRFRADEDHGYEAVVQSFQAPDNFPKNSPFKVKVEFDYHIGMDERDDTMYDVSWCGYIALEQGGAFQPPTWAHIAYVNPYEWEPGVEDKEIFEKTFTGSSGPLYFEARCWLTYYVYTWDDIHQEWNYWKDDYLEDDESKEINFPINKPYLKASSSILMADETTKRIEDVNVNDYIIAYDFINDSTISTKVVELYNTTPVSANYLKINTNITVSPETRLYVNEIWTYAKNASIGDYLTTSAGPSEQITSIQNISISSKVYGFKVENYSSFYAENYLIQTNNA